MYGKVPGVWYNLKWVNEKQKMVQWTVNIIGKTKMEGHHLQRMVDVDGVLTLIWCRKCAVWSTFRTLGRSSNHCKVKDPRLVPTQETRTRFQVERHCGRASSAWTQCAYHKGLSLSVYLRFMMKALAWRNVEFGIECKSKSLHRRKKSKGAR